MEENNKIENPVALLRRIVWDYSIDPEEIYDFVMGKRKTLYHFTKEMIFLRILERLSWYEILELLPLQIIKNMLNTSTIEKLRTVSLKEKYEYARRVLQKEPVSPSRWHYQNHKEYPFPLLSDRWYSAE